MASLPFLSQLKQHNKDQLKVQSKDACNKKANIFIDTKVASNAKPPDTDLEKIDCPYKCGVAPFYKCDNHVAIAHASEMLPGKLYLGNKDNAESRTELKRMGITDIINVTTEEAQNFLKEYSYTNYEIDDMGDVKIGEYFNLINRKIEELIENKKVVLVHCLHGRSRSATIVIAFVMYYMKMSKDDAYNYVKKRRQFIEPRPEFHKELLQYEKELHSKS